MGTLTIIGMLILVAMVIVLGVDRLFGDDEEYERTQEDLEEEAEFKTSYCNAVANAICQSYNVAASEITSEAHPIGIGEFVIEFKFRDYAFVILFNFVRNFYYVTAYFDEDGEKVVKLKKRFKIKWEEMVDYAAIDHFLHKFNSFTSVDLTHMTFDHLVQEVARVAQDPVFKEMSEEEINSMLHRAALYMAYSMQSRKCRRNRDAVMAYSMLMTYLSSDEERNKAFVDFIISKQDPQINQTENEEV